MATTVLDGTDFETPVEERYFEDYVPGTVCTYGSITVSEAEILDFAQRFDPQDIHRDPQAAQDGPFNGLIASGWHTTALMMRLYADHYVSKVPSLASRGRRAAPGPAGQAGGLPRHPYTIREARVSRSKPDRGLVHTQVEVLSQHAEPVLTMTVMNMLRRRPTGA